MEATWTQPARRSLPRTDAEILPYAVAAGVLLTIAVGLSADSLGARWGTPLPPFVGPWAPQAHPAAVLAAAVLAAAVAAASPLLRAGRTSSGAFAAGAFGLALALRLAVGAARDGTSGWYSVFSTDFEAKNEYLPALPALDGGAALFLDRFAELVPALPVHSAGHPPGLLLTLHWLGIDSAEGMAALVILAACAGVPLLYLLGRPLAGESGARVAALLYAFAPAAVLYGASSADALYATLGIAAALALVHSRLVGALVLAVASLFSYALLAVGAWAALLELTRRGARSAAALGATCAACLIAFYAALYAATGFDLPGALASTSAVYDNSVARIRPYPFWLFGSPAAFFVALGLPVSWLALRAMAARVPLALALAAIVIAAAVLGFTKAETERIWLFMAPLACLAAAGVLPRERVGLVLAVLAAQALAAEILFYTVW